MPNSSEQSVPYHLRSQLEAMGGNEKTLERCRPGKPGFLPAYSSEYFNDSRPERESDVPRVGYCFDGSFLPIRNGCSYTLYNLMKAVGQSEKAQPFFVVCDRGFDETKQYFGQDFSTVFVSPEDYYQDNGVLEQTFAAHGINIAQFYSSEGVINLAPRLKRASINTIFEVQNTDYHLLSQLGASTDDIELARDKQIFAQELSDVIFTRSEGDMMAALELGANPNTIYRYNGGIDVEGIEFQPYRQQRGRLVYLGHMFYEPNQRAVENIISNILPNLDDHFSLTVIGVSPSDLKERYESLGINCLSDVDDISAALLNYDIALAPITEGSGTRLKLLDYLASGIPTISTSMGIDGLNNEIRNSIIVEDDLSKQAEIVRVISSNPELYLPRALNGRRYVESHYSWKNAVGVFNDIYEDLDRKRRQEVAS